MQMSLLADLPNQITQVIENAVGAAAEGEEEKKLTHLSDTRGSQAARVRWEGEVSIKWIRGNKRGNGGRIADELWRNAGAWKVGAFHEQDVDLIPTTAPLVYWQVGNSVTVSQELTSRRPADSRALAAFVYVKGKHSF